MKEFLKNFAIICVVAAPFLFVMFRSVDTVWEPIEKTGGSGTQAVGESDLVLPGGGEDMATAQRIPVSADNGMTDAEKLAFIDTFLDDAFEYFWELDDANLWKGVAICVSDIVNFGGVASG